MSAAAAGSASRSSSWSASTNGAPWFSMARSSRAVRWNGPKPAGAADSAPAASNPARCRANAR